MKKWKKLVIIVVVLLVGAFWVQARGSSQFLNNGFQALFYHSMRIEGNFPSVNPLGIALQEFEKAVKEGEPTGEALLMMAMIYQHLNRPGTALGYYLQFAETQPEEVWVYPLIGDLYHEMGRTQEANECYTRAVGDGEGEQSFARAYFGIGTVAFEQGHYQEAKEAFEQALSNSGDFLDARLNLGKTLYYLEDYDQAIETLERAQLQAPRSPLVLYYLGLSYEAVGRLEQAQHSFQRMEEVQKTR